MASESKAAGSEPLVGGRILLGLAGALLVAAGAVFVVFGRLNHDEGWYLYAARLVTDGVLPYRDFPFYQAPVLPFVHGLPQWIAPGVETGRWTSFAITCVTCAIALRLAHRVGGALAVCVFAAGLVGSPLALWALNSTRTEPLCALFSTAAIGFLLDPQRRARSGALAVAAGALAAMSRITMVPAAALIVVIALVRCGASPRDRAIVLAPLVLVFVVGALLATLVGWELAWVNLVEIQSERFDQFREARPLSFATWWATRLHFFGRVWSEFGVIACVAGVAALAAPGVVLSQSRGQEIDPALRSASLVAAVAALALLPNLIPRSAYTVYFASILPIVLIAGGWSLAAFARWLGSSGMDPRHRFAFGLGAVAGISVLQISVFASQLDVWIARNPTDLERLRDASKRIETRWPDDGPLLTFDTYLAVETGREVPPGFEMGVFSWFPRRPNEDGTRYGLLTNDRLADAFASPEIRALALSDVSIGVLATRSHNGFRPKHVMTQDELWLAYPALRRFRLVETIEAFGQLQAPLYLMEAVEGVDDQAAPSASSRRRVSS